MKLTIDGIKNTTDWEKASIVLPGFDIEEVKKETYNNPFWIHFGAGNIFRAFQARCVQKLLNDGDINAGLVVAEGFDYQIIDKVNYPYDNLSLVATLKASGAVDLEVVASVCESLKLDDSHIDYDRLKAIFAKESLQMATFTITEKGYAPSKYMENVFSLLLHRYNCGELPIALVSMDNCSHNGDKLKAMALHFANKWIEEGKTDQGFMDYINGDKVSFPWTMIDKITPRPDDSVMKMIQAKGVEDMSPVITDKNTYVAPFVNAEECEYLVIEDSFPNGRPDLTKCGFIFTDRETVDKVERMKVCTCLNPLHTCLAIYGCLLGFTKISDEMEDADLCKMVNIIGHKEGMPVVTDPGVLSPDEFLDAVLKERIPNPFMPDTPQRIATDTSQKLPIRFGETIKRYVASDSLDVNSLEVIPLVFAGWIRYLMAIDDNGNTFERSQDPMFEQVDPIVNKLIYGVNDDNENILKELLKNKVIFGVDLYEVGLAKKVLDYFAELNSGNGCIRKVIHQTVEQF